MIRAILPLTLMGYFFYRAQRQRIFWLGIPFVMFMGSAVFFDQFVHLPILSKVLTRLDSNQLIMVTLLIVWFLCCGGLKPFKQSFKTNIGLFGGNHLFTEEIPWILIGASVILAAFLSIFRENPLGDVIKNALEISYLGIGYFLVRGIVSRSSSHDVIVFLNSLVLVNTIAAFLYFLHQGLQLPIYQGQEYLKITFLGQQITRTFWFMPSLLIFSIVFEISKPKVNLVTLGIIGINLLAIAISYTRYLIALGVLLIILPLVMRAFKGQHRWVVKRVIGVCLLGVIFVWAVQQFFPVQMQYLWERVSGLTSGNVNTLTIRQNFGTRTWDMLRNSEIYIGAGFPIEERDSRIFYINQWRADYVWIPVLFHLGGVGVIGFASLLFLGLLKSWKLFWHYTGEGEFLGMVLFSFLLAVVVEGFFSASFMYWIRYPLGLWYLAFVSVEVNRVRSQQVKSTITPNLKS